jgi:hypothetical protein
MKITVPDPAWKKNAVPAPQHWGKHCFALAFLHNPIPDKLRLSTIDIS